MLRYSFCYCNASGDDVEETFDGEGGAVREEDGGIHTTGGAREKFFHTGTHQGQQILVR